MAELQCPGCGSARVESLQLFVAKVTADSLQPEWTEPGVRTLSRGWPLLFLAVGVVALFSGAILPGIMVALAAAVWLSRVNGTIRADEARREKWLRTRICLICKKTFPASA
ncbi:hypothetical protein PV703_30720 [Streptomyces sp. ME01-24h]|nr:hypothetical protein [Streptomyces sp. ME19-03-3]MDX3357602.1 hypothetical protein [Streptomyces sp. ME01-24h]